jgi:hypothetical protein
MQTFHAIRADGDGTVEQPWALYNETATGARLKVNPVKKLPAEFALSIDGSERRCVVAWRLNGEVGLKFEQTP